MAKLTRYKSFKELKSDPDSIITVNVERVDNMKEFEHFVTSLRKSSTLKTKKIKSIKAYNER